jgi:hypothetical protein
MLFGKGPTVHSVEYPDRQNAAAILGLSTATTFDEVYAVSRHPVLRRRFWQVRNQADVNGALISLETARREDMLEVAFGRYSPSARFDRLYDRLVYDPFSTAPESRHTGNLIDQRFPSDMLERAVIHFTAIGNELHPGPIEVTQLIGLRLLPYANDGRLQAMLEVDSDGGKTRFANLIEILKEKLARSSLALSSLDNLQNALENPKFTGSVADCGGTFIIPKT